MAENSAICLVGTMDRLWFHQIIIFSEPTSLLFPKTLETPTAIPESLSNTSSICSLPPSVAEEEILSVTSTITPPKDDCENEDSEKEIKLKERSTRLNVVAGKTLSHSSSPSAKNRLRNLRYSGAAPRLQKTMSCNSLWELEVEEVKGFMDLGFKFNKENVSPRMIGVVPGLQRLSTLGDFNDEQKDAQMINADEVAKDDEIEEEEDEEKRGVMRPYLSEAWLIKRPDSPMLNLRMPRVFAAAEMKKHLRYWARTVASVIQQES